MTDYRSPEAAAYRPLYRTKAWQRLRFAILTRDLFTCQMCGKAEGNTSQLVADHKTPHKGNLNLFWDEANIWTLCAPCHNSTKQSEERTGYSKAIGSDGWPTDARHPANRPGGG
jgi:5-methylcytosine-specific restriction protein A